ncbi:GNAT family N-acetyltransferase [Thermodesulfobacteriota bacterium]
MSHRETSLRECTSGDFEEVKRLIDTTIDICYTRDYSEAVAAYFKQLHSADRIARDAEKGYTVVLEVEGLLIGTGTLVGDHVFRVFVDPQFQRRGYGRLIMDKLEQKARSSGVAEITLDVALNAVQFYHQLGYRFSEEAFLDAGDGQRLAYHVVKKRL